MPTNNETSFDLAAIARQYSQVEIESEINDLSEEEQLRESLKSVCAPFVDRQQEMQSETNVIHVDTQFSKNVEDQNEQNVESESNYSETESVVENNTFHELETTAGNPNDVSVAEKQQETIYESDIEEESVVSNQPMEVNGGILPTTAAYRGRLWNEFIECLQETTEEDAEEKVGLRYPIDVDLIQTLRECDFGKSNTSIINSILRVFLIDNLYNLQKVYNPSSKSLFHKINE